MVIEEFVEKLINQGFAIFVGSYLLIRIEKKLDKVIEALDGQKC